MLDQATKSCGISLSYRTPSFPASRPNGHGTLHLAKNAPLTGIRRCHPEMYAANRRIWVFAPSHWEYPAFHPCIPVLLSVPPCPTVVTLSLQPILPKPPPPPPTPR